MNIMRWEKSLFNLMTTAGLAVLAVSCTVKDQAIVVPNLSSTVSGAGSSFSGVTQADTIGATKVKLSWNASPDPTVIAYNVYDISNLFTPKLLKTVPIPATSVTLNSLVNENLYTFRVRAANALNVEDSNTASAQAIPYAGVLSVIVNSSTSATLTYSDASNADQVQVFCMTNLAPTYVLQSTVTDVTLTQVTLTGLTPGSLYTCRVALVSSGFVDNNTRTVTFTPIGQATQMVFTTQPGSAVSAAPLSPQPVVKILDANGNLVSAGPDATAQVTLIISPASPDANGSVQGNPTAVAVGGIATFTGINIKESGIKILTASKNDTSAQLYGSGPLTVDSNQFTISPGPVSAAASTITIAPAGPLVANGSATYTVSITLKDVNGNPIPGIKPTFGSTNGVDTISQPTANTDATGLSTGSIGTTASGLRTLSITSPSGLSSDTVSATFVAGPPTKLAFVQQPTNSPAGAGTMNTIIVAVEDSQGNIVTTSSASIALSIFVNPGGGTLTGSTTLAVANGVGTASFNGLGISKTGTGYKLVANSAPLSVAYSNAFNVVPGVPAKVILSGPTAVLSGACSTAYTLQLQDNGGNPTNATGNTLISFSGMGAGGFYLSSACSGSAVGSSVTFATGSNTKTLYFKDMKAQALTLTATDPSAVLTTGTLPMNTTPAQVALTGPTSVVAGQCSTAFTITTAGADGSAGNVVATTPFQITGLAGSLGNFYSDAACATSALNPNSINVSAGTGLTNIYFKDNKAESLMVGVADPAVIMTTTSSNQALNVLASNIAFTGPASVVSGVCSTAFTITLKDAAGNPVTAPAATPLTINGLGGHQGNFYANNACSGAPLGTTVTVPMSSSTTMMYFKDNTAENLTIYLSDPAVQLANSPNVVLGVSPSALTISGPVAGNANTSLCAGPFTVNTRDGGGNVTAAITPINVTMAGAGTAGSFYSDVACGTSVTSFTFSTGDSAKTFYYQGLAPGAFNFTATDNAAVLAQGTLAWTVNAAPAWIGTGGGSGGGGTATLGAGSPYTWQMNKVPVTARMDAPQSVYNLHFDSTKQYLYSVDYSQGRVFKYDYLHSQYVGWIGMFVKNGNIGMTGSNQFTDATTGQPYTTASANNQCITAPHGATTPGWCQGGQVTNSSVTTSGQMYNPYAVTDDGTYVYVTQYSGGNINRYNAVTGQFTGWIGRIGSATGLTSGIDNNGASLGNCSVANVANSVTPGWCQGGTNVNNNGSYANYGDGGVYAVQAIAYSGSGYIYVSTQGMINRYSAASGAFAGWIGRVSATSVTVNGTAHGLATAPGASNACATTGAGVQTPGWCVWGTAATGTGTTVQTGAIDRPTGLLVDDSNDLLYVVQGDNSGTISQFQLSTGAFIKRIASGGVPTAFSSPNSITMDATFLYVADSNRILKIDTTGTVWGWIGKVGNNSSMSDATGNTGAGCATLSINANTPGWCMGGGARNGIDEQSVHQLQAIEFDGAGYLLTGQGYSYPAIKKWAVGSGAYQGMLSNTANSPAVWQNSQVPAGFYGFDDNSMFTPSGMYSDGTSLFVAEAGATRVKKISVGTGATQGWLGGVGGVIPGATPTTGCGPNSIGMSIGWCLGAFFSPNYLWTTMAPTNANGMMNYPLGVAGNGTSYLYVVDYGWHRILRFDLTGAFKGWIGGISGTATSGPATPGDSAACNGANSQFTPGWCVGGTPAAGSGNGYLNGPTSITYYNGNLYVVDYNNFRVNAYNATTGAFIGWIGRVNSTVGLSPAAIPNTGYNYTNGWSTGGTSQQSVQGGDPGGGFSFCSGRTGIGTDGTYLYVTNCYNSRVDRFVLATGIYQGSFRSRWDTYTNVWTNPATWKAWGTATTVPSWGNEGYYPNALWVSGTKVYYTGASGAGTVVKADLGTGSVIGWQGAISTSPSGGDPACVGATGTTPGWCQGGSYTQGYMLGDTNHLGGFSGGNYGLAGDANFVYVSDENTHRVTRLPK